MPQVLLKVIEEKLPILPARVARLLEALEHPEKYSTAQIAALVAQCGNLEQVVLDMLNSGFFRTRRRAQSIQDAFLLIGSDAARSVVLAVVLKGLFPQRELIPNFDRGLFLRHCIGTALASEMLAERIGVADESSRYRFSTYGFTHDIGTLALDYCAPITLNRVFAYAQREKVSILNAERVILGELTHGVVGAHVCRLWGLPKDIANVAEHHHRPAQARTDQQEVAILYVGDGVSWNYYEKLLGSRGLRYPVDPTVVAGLGLTEAHLAEVEEELPGRVEEAVRLLNVEAVDLRLLS